jgi:hypothetical protein
MRRFYKNLNENEFDPEELNDFRKILAINKRKLDPSDAWFVNSDGKDFSNIIEVTQDGLLFHFEDLEEYLKFFFPKTFEGGSDGEWDAQNYDRMYYGQWSFYDDFSDRSGDDWAEGFVVNSFSHGNMALLKDLIEMVSPSLLSKINYYQDSKKQQISDNDSKLISDFLATLNIDDDITGVYIDAQVNATEEECKKAVRDTYCNCFYDIGIENYSRYCFKTYKLDWGSAILLYARFGTEDDRLLDLLFDATDNNSRNHLPEYYEMQYNYWDRDKFNETFYPGVDKILEKKISDILENEDYNPKYFKTIESISRIGGSGTWIESKDKKFKIKVRDIDPKTAKITYDISANAWGGKMKLAKSDIKVLLNYLNQGHLFDPTEYRT